MKAIAHTFNQSKPRTKTHRPYFLGFGLLPACATSLLPFFVGVGAYAMVFPLVRPFSFLRVSQWLTSTHTRSIAHPRVHMT